MVGPNVYRLQYMLNRIARSYPAIPTIALDGNYDEETEAAVRKFQEVFNLTADGVVGKATWYKAVFLYAGLNKLSELASQGQPPTGPIPPPNRIPPREGDEGEGVRTIQQMLSVVSQFYSNVPGVTVDGDVGPDTTQAVKAVQRMAGLAQDGVVGDDTWEALYRAYAGITDAMEEYTNMIPLYHRPELGPEQPSWLTRI